MSKLNLKKALIPAIASVATAATLFSGAAQSASEDGTANAVVVVPITIAEVQPLDFGTVAPGTSSLGRVKIDSAGVVTALETATHFSGGAVGRFNLTGMNNASYSVALPVFVVLNSGAETITVNNFTSDKTLTGNSLDAAGIGSINVGATLQLPAGQKAGSYSGPYTVEVLYE